MAEHNELGTLGEQVAVEHLVRCGYRICERNWRSGRRELDIVALKDGELVVVEVKTRGSGEYGSPTDAIDSRKIRRIVAAADAYIRLKALDIPVRFDVISILHKSGGEHHITHIEDAFYPPLEFSRR